MRHVLVLLSGVAGVGKTTIARVLEEEHGFLYVPVEAEVCWSEADPVRRQECFKEEFLRRIAFRMNEDTVVVADNSLATVAAYSYALVDRAASIQEAAHLLRISYEALTWENALPDALHVLVEANLPVIKERILRRLAEDRLREKNWVEREIEIHAKAQAFLRSVKGWDMKLMNQGAPEEAAKIIAKKIEEIMRKKR